MALSEAPTPVAVPAMPRPRLKWPVPRVTSATTSGTMTANTEAVTPSSSCTTTSSSGLLTEANSRPRIAKAAKPISSNGRRPQSWARVPTDGDSTATTTCGTTMQAAINTVAHSAERMVTTLPIKGSMAPLARWNSSRQPAKMRSGRLRMSSATLVRGLSVRRRGTAPWARSGSISLGVMVRSAKSAGPSNSTVTMNTARADNR